MHEFKMLNIHEMERDKETFIDTAASENSLLLNLWLK